MLCWHSMLQEPPAPGAPGPGGRQELLSAARNMLDRKAAAAGKRGAHFPLLLNSSGVMVSMDVVAQQSAELRQSLCVAGLNLGAPATGSRSKPAGLHIAKPVHRAYISNIQHCCFTLSCSQ